MKEIALSVVQTASTSTDRHTHPETAHTMSHTAVQASTSDASLNRTNLPTTYHGTHRHFLSPFQIEVNYLRSVFSPTETFRQTLVSQTLYYSPLAGLI